MAVPLGGHQQLQGCRLVAIELARQDQQRLGRQLVAPGLGAWIGSLGLGWYRLEG